MNINEVSKLVGMNSGTIRFYESKGLIEVKRSDNSYRSYDADAVDILKKIKFLRYMGVSVSDIRLWRNNILSEKELLNRRLKELKKEKELNSKQLRLCIDLLENNGDISSFSTEMKNYQDNIDEKSSDSLPVHIGLDIGTTTISLVILGSDLKTVYECYNIQNGCEIESEPCFHKVQDAELLTKKAIALIDMGLKYYKNVRTIGITGQMHGILYVNNKGKAVSGLYTWQDKSGDELTEGKTYCKYINEITGEKTASGYGLVTHYYLAVNNKLPCNAYKFCTVMDYIRMILTSEKAPLVHVTNAASFGFFCCRNNQFKLNKLKKLGIDINFLPNITDTNISNGKYKNIPVAVAIGDNQASFIGSVDKPDESLLINIGTGSQISLLSDYCGDEDSCYELRPFINGLYLKSYSALCGGYAYEILEKFFRKIAYYITGEYTEQYFLMRRITENEYTSSDLTINTAFNGTRQNPHKKGSILNISSDNFLPENLIYGFSEGIVRELYEKYLEISDNNSKIKYLTVSGNGARRNNFITDIIKKLFKKEIILKNNEEEAAIGAAIFSKGMEYQ